MFEINVFGQFLCTQAAVKQMSTRLGGKGGAIVNVASEAGLNGYAGITV